MDLTGTSDSPGKAQEESDRCDMSETNKKVIKRMFGDVLNGHKLESYADLYSEIVFRGPGLGELRQEEHQHFLGSFAAAFPDGQWEIEDLISEKDRVAVRWSFRGTHSGTFMGVDGTGRQVQCTGTSIYQIAKGKIVGQWDEWDTLGMAQQLSAPREMSVGDLVAP